MSRRRAAANMAGWLRTVQSSKSPAAPRDAPDVQSVVRVGRRPGGSVADGPPRRVEGRAGRAHAAALSILWHPSHQTRMPLHGVIGVRSDARSKRAVNPALIEHARERAEHFENRIADRITAFSGSMRFVYLHAIWFACWIGFRVEPYPFGLLTMIVSLEAIFLSTFVMISQNRADAKREVLANQILELTKAVHTYAEARSDGVPAARRDKARDRDPT